MIEKSGLSPTEIEADRQDSLDADESKPEIPESQRIFESDPRVIEDYLERDLFIILDAVESGKLPKAELAKAVISGDISYLYRYVNLNLFRLERSLWFRSMSVLYDRSLLSRCRDEVAVLLEQPENLHSLLATSSYRIISQVDAKLQQSEGSPDVFVISESMINPVTSWYLESVLANPSLLRDAFTEVSGETHYLCRALLTALHIYGYLENKPVSRDVEIVTHLLYGHIQTINKSFWEEIPAVVKERVEKVIEISTPFDSPRVAGLKKFWKGFNPYWMSLAMAHGESKAPLTAEEQKLAGRYVIDTRFFDTPLNAKHFSRMASNPAAGGHTYHHLQMMDEHGHAVMAQQAAQQKQMFARSLSQDVVSGYGGLDIKPSQIKSVFAGNKDGLILQTIEDFVDAEDHREVNEQCIQQLWGRLEQVVLRERKQNPDYDPLPILFGEKHEEVPVFEKVCVVIFTSLVIADGSALRYKKAVDFISHQLIPVFNDYHDVEAPNKVTAGEGHGYAAFNPRKTAKLEDKALERLDEYQFSDGLIAAMDERLSEELDERYQEIHALKRLAEQLKIYNDDSFLYLLITMVNIIGGGLVIGLGGAALSTDFQPGDLSNLFWVAEIAMVTPGFMIGMWTLIYQNHEFRRLLHNIGNTDILAASYQKTVGRLNLTHERKMRLANRVTVALFVALLLLFPMLNFADKNSSAIGDGLEAMGEFISEEGDEVGETIAEGVRQGAERLGIEGKPGSIEESGEQQGQQQDQQPAEQPAEAANQDTGPESDGKSDQQSGQETESDSTNRDSDAAGGSSSTDESEKDGDLGNSGDLQTPSDSSEKREGHADPELLLSDELPQPVPPQPQPETPQPEPPPPDTSETDETPAPENRIPPVENLPVPETIDPESLKDAPFREYSQLLTPLPDKFPQQGYFAYKPFVLGYTAERPLVLNLFSDLHVEQIASLDGFVPNVTENQWAERMYTHSNTLAPYDEARIVAVYMAEDGSAYEGQFGDVHFGGTPPPEVVVVYELLDDKEIRRSPSNRVTWIQNGEGYNYNPWDNWDETYEEALALNRTLAPDSQLQKIHADLVAEANEVVRSLHRGETSEEEAAQYFMELFEFYSEKLGEYVDSYRQYSLEFEVDVEKGDNTVLRELASDPDQSFFCAVAALLEMEFIHSVGGDAFARPGATMMVQEGSIYYRIGHVNVGVVPPQAGNGYYIVDLTPATPDPDADLSALQDPPFTKDRIVQDQPQRRVPRPPAAATPPEQAADDEDDSRRKLEEIAKLFALAAAGGLGLEVARRTRKSIRRRREERRLRQHSRLIDRVGARLPSSVLGEMQHQVTKKKRLAQGKKYSYQPNELVAEITDIALEQPVRTTNLTEQVESDALVLQATENIMFTLLMYLYEKNPPITVEPLTDRQRERLLSDLTTSVVHTVERHQDNDYSHFYQLKKSMLQSLIGLNEEVQEVKEGTMSVKDLGVSYFERLEQMKPEERAILKDLLTQLKSRLKLERKAGVEELVHELIAVSQDYDQLRGRPHPPAAQLEELHKRVDQLSTRIHLFEIKMASLSSVLSLFTAQL